MPKIITVLHRGQCESERSQLVFWIQQIAPRNDQYCKIIIIYSRDSDNFLNTFGSIFYLLTLKKNLSLINNITLQYNCSSFDFLCHYVVATAGYDVVVVVALAVAMMWWWLLLWLWL